MQDTSMESSNTQPWEVLDLSCLNDHVLDIVMASAAKGAPPANVRALSLVCKRFRASVLRTATTLIMTHDSDDIPLASCCALRAIVLQGTCTRLPLPPFVAASTSTNSEVNDAAVLAGNSLPHLWKLTRLEVGVSVERFPAGELSKLRGIPTLHEVVISGCANVCDREVAHLEHCSRLRSMSLSCCCRLSDAGVHHIAALPALERLHLENCAQLTEQGLKYISAMPSLQHLRLSGCSHITDSGLRHLTALTELRSLAMMGWSGVRVSSSAIDRLRKLPHLEELSFGPSLMATMRDVAQEMGIGFILPPDALFDDDDDGGFGGYYDIDDEDDDDEDDRMHDLFYGLGGYGDDMDEYEDDMDDMDEDDEDLSMPSLYDSDADSEMPSMYSSLEDGMSTEGSEPDTDDSGWETVDEEEEGVAHAMLQGGSAFTELD